MRLSGEVVKKAADEWKDKTTGEIRQAWKIYLKPADVLDGATEVTISEQEFGAIEEGKSVSFDVALGLRPFGNSQRVAVRSLGNLEGVKVKS